MSRSEEESRSTLCGLENLEIRANCDRKTDAKIENYAFPRNFVRSNEAKGQVHLLQESLFPNLCSTIYFGVSGEESMFVFVITLLYVENQKMLEYAFLSFKFLFLLRLNRHFSGGSPSSPRISFVRLSLDPGSD